MAWGEVRWGGGVGHRVRNESGLTFLKFARAHELVILSSYFRKRDDNLINYKIGAMSYKLIIFFFEIRILDSVRMVIFFQK